MNNNQYSDEEIQAARAEEQPSYYAIIPSVVRYNKNLTLGARMLYGEITALCKKAGYCWAANSYFANLYEVDPNTIARWLKQLEAIGVIKMLIIPERGNIRRIWLPEAEAMQRGTHKNVERGTHKNVGRYPQKCGEGTHKNVSPYIENSTLNSTKNSTHTSSEKKKRAKQADLIPYTSDQLPPPLNTQEMQDAWDDWLAHCIQQKRPMTERSCHILVKQLLEIGPERAIKAIYRSIKGRWQTVWEDEDERKKAEAEANSGPNRQAFLKKLEAEGKLI